MPNARTKLFGVIGDPVGHSLSPVLHNYFLKKYKLNAFYFAFRVVPANLAACVQGAWAMGLAGLNVTLPHKEKVVELVKFRSPEVNLLGVANTLSMREEGVAAFVTDPAGFMASVQPLQTHFSESRVVLFGAGGSARSVAYALSKMGARELTIVNRTYDRALQLSRFCTEQLGFRKVSILGMRDPALNDHILGAQALVNATSIGMAPYVDYTPLQDFSAVSQNHFVYDLVYNPVWTVFLREAKKNGAKVQNGLDMLIYQGLESLQIWMNETYTIARNELNALRIQLSTELQS